MKTLPTNMRVAPRTTIMVLMAIILQLALAVKLAVSGPLRLRRAEGLALMAVLVLAWCYAAYFDFRILVPVQRRLRSRGYKGIRLQDVYFLRKEFGEIALDLVPPAEQVQSVPGYGSTPDAEFLRSILRERMVASPRSSH